MLRFFIFLFLPLSFFSQVFRSAQADSLFERLRANEKVLGSFGLFKAGKPVYLKTLEYTKKPINAETRYRIGSISKMFTAVVILQLIEEKKLSFATPLSDFFPEIPNASKITIEHLLRHRSGIFNFTNTPDYKSYHTRKMSRRKLLKKIASFNPMFTPGSMYNYSNSNYVLLTFIAEKIEKKSFGKILEKRVLIPCGLENTRYGEKLKPNKNVAVSYVKIEKWQEVPSTHPSVPRGAGSITSTVTDLNRFVNCLFYGDLLSSGMLAQMKTFRDDYGMGMFSFPFHDKTFYGHNGHIDEFYSLLGHNPEDSVTLIYLSNGREYPLNKIAIALLKMYYNEPYLLPDFSEYAVQDSLLEQYVGTYSAENFPLKITVRKKGSKLTAQADGQAEFPLTAYDKNKFKFETARIEMEFYPKLKRMIFRQGKIKRIFYKE